MWAPHELHNIPNFTNFFKDDQKNYFKDDLAFSKKHSPSREDVGNHVAFGWTHMCFCADSGSQTEVYPV